MQATELRPLIVSLCAVAAGLGGTSIAEGQLAVHESPPAAVASDPSPRPTYGTEDQTVHTLHAHAFEPYSGAGDDLVATPLASRYCTSGGCIVLAPLMLPAGAAIEAIELEACDLNDEGQIQGALFRIGPLETSFELLAVAETGESETPGCTLILEAVAPSHTVNNDSSSYLVQVAIVGDDASTRFQAVRVFYRLQLAPPPGIATFGDVPTSHPFFQHIEALAESGITGGCGGGDYCPNDPLTRGQMAVFLAKALGLHWPN